jgi:hypothetical protein
MSAENSVPPGVRAILVQLPSLFRSDGAVMLGARLSMYQRGSLVSLSQLGSQ